MKYKGRPKSANIQDRRLHDLEYEKWVHKKSDYSHLVTYKKPKKSKKELDKRG